MYYFCYNPVTLDGSWVIDIHVTLEGSWVIDINGKTMHSIDEIGPGGASGQDLRGQTVAFLNIDSNRATPFDVEIGQTIAQRHNGSFRYAQDHMEKFAMFIAILPCDAMEGLKDFARYLYKCMMYYFCYNPVTLEGSWIINVHGKTMHSLDEIGPGGASGLDMRGQTVSFLNIDYHRATQFDVEVGKTIAQRHNGSFRITNSLLTCSDYMFSPMYMTSLGSFITLPEMFQICFLVPRSSLKSIFSILLDPFDHFCWAAFMLTICVVSLLLSLFGESYRRYNIGLVSLELVMNALNGPTHRFEGRLEVRIVGLFMLMNIVLISCYQSLVISFMSSARYDPELDTIEQINDTCQFERDMYLQSLGYRFKNIMIYPTAPNDYEERWANKYCVLDTCSDLTTGHTQIESGYKDHNVYDEAMFNHYYRYSKARLRAATGMYLVYNYSPMRNLIERYTSSYSEGHLHHLPLLLARKGYSNSGTFHKSMTVLAMSVLQDHLDRFAVFIAILPTDMLDIVRKFAARRYRCMMYYFCYERDTLSGSWIVDHYGDSVTGLENVGNGWYLRGQQLTFLNLDSERSSPYDDVFGQTMAERLNGSFKEADDIMECYDYVYSSPMGHMHIESQNDMFYDGDDPEFTRYYRYSKVRLRSTIVMYLISNYSPLRELIKRYAESFVEGHIHHLSLLKTGKIGAGRQNVHPTLTVFAMSAEDLQLRSDRHFAIKVPIILIVPESELESLLLHASLMDTCILYLYVYDPRTLNGSWTIYQSANIIWTLESFRRFHDDMRGYRISFQNTDFLRDTTYDMAIGHTIARRHNATFAQIMQFAPDECVDYDASPVIGGTAHYIPLPEMNELCFSVPKSAAKSVFHILLDPYDSFSWIAFGLTIAIISLVLVSFSKSERNSNVVFIALEMLMIVLNGPTHQLDERFDRFVVGLFMLLTIVLISGYQSLVISFLSMARYEPHLDTLELINDTCLFLYNPHMSSSGYTFKNVHQGYDIFDSVERMWQVKYCSLSTCTEAQYVMTHVGVADKPRSLQQGTITLFSEDEWQHMKRALEYFRYSKARMHSTPAMYRAALSSPVRHLLKYYTQAFVEGQLHYFPMLMA
uniref:Ionotropic glutamate receptor C-terminal domain-containing protein n=1 Tax=Anopheles dirus TaxID=7168 RepID=A0A182NAQ9_9DIPT